MMARDTRIEDQPLPTDSSATTAGVGLTEEERLAIQAAAEAEGYSESFADLLCRFAALMGAEEVLGELKRLDEPKDPDS
jgi:hypothetical protein